MCNIATSFKSENSVDLRLPIRNIIYLLIGKEDEGMSTSRPNTGITAIELRMGSFIVYPTLLWDERNLVLVDTGIPGQLDRIRTLLEREGFD